MKTWLTYLAAAAMGIAFELTLKNSAYFIWGMNFLSEVVLKLGMFIVFPLAFFSMSAGTASLSRRNGSGTFVFLSSILWAALSTIVLSFCATLIFSAFPAAFPVTSTVPENAQQAAALYDSLTSSSLSGIYSANPLSVNAFANFIKSGDCLLPIVFLALIFGYAARPTSEIVRPAYITLNSISEVMFRLAKKVSQLLWVGVFFLSGTWVYRIVTDGTVFISWKFTVLLGTTCILLLFVLIPLLYALCTGFRRNPYRQILRLLSSAVAAFVSGNYLFSQSTLYTDCRINLGIQKNVVSTALPLHSILTKGGTALVSSLCTCAFISATTGAIPSIIQMVTIAFACTLVSFVCCLHAGYEVLFGTAFALRLLNIDISGAEFAIIGLLPLLNGIALLFDVLLSGLGTSFTAYHMNADCHVRSGDTV